jgi:hypothetical protein
MRGEAANETPARITLLCEFGNFLKKIVAKRGLAVLVANTRWNMGTDPDALLRDTEVRFRRTCFASSKVTMSRMNGVIVYSVITSVPFHTIAALM